MKKEIKDRVQNGLKDAKEIAKAVFDADDVHSTIEIYKLLVYEERNPVGANEVASKLSNKLEGLLNAQKTGRKK